MRGTGYMLNATIKICRRCTWFQWHGFAIVASQRLFAQLPSMRLYIFRDFPSPNTIQVSCFDCVQVMKRRRSSSVWDHFAQPDDGRKMKCHHCNTKLSYVGGTTVMLNHLKLKHPELIDGENRPPAQRQLSLSEAFSGGPFTAFSALSRLTLSVQATMSMSPSKGSRTLLLGS